MRRNEPKSYAAKLCIMQRGDGLLKGNAASRADGIVQPRIFRCGAPELPAGESSADRTLAEPVAHGERPIGDSSSDG
jgi:hypothetical protein